MYRAGLTARNSTGGGGRERVSGAALRSSPAPMLRSRRRRSRQQEKREVCMVFDLNRRQALVLGSTSFLSGLLMAGGASAEASDTLTIAFNVNLPAFDPTSGP